jgi:uncharacterized protein (TIGR04255 family)
MECEFMAQARQSSRAPITEAIVDIRVKARRDLDPRTFQQLRSVIADRFPTVEEHRGIETQVLLQPGQSSPPVTKDLGLLGYFLRSPDKLTVLQFRTDGFTLNRLKPYTSWNNLRPLAVEMWNKYEQIARPEAITRTALRYNIQLPLPPSFSVFEEYLAAAPVVPDSLPQHVSSFLTRITLHDPLTQNAANIVQALQVTSTSPEFTVILDIDAFNDREISVEDPGLPERLNGLRELKNTIFFSSLTEKTIALFQ